jgi:hypothetical protein
MRQKRQLFAFFWQKIACFIQVSITTADKWINATASGSLTGNVNDNFYSF